MNTETATYNDLKDKIAVVTGAGGGIGQATVRALCANGVKVIATDLDIEAIALAFAGLDVECEHLNVTDVEAIRGLVERIEARHAGIDIWVNNAGMLARSSALELSTGDWQRTLDVNLKGAFFGAQAAAACMLKRGSGAIVNLSSYAGIKARPNCADYASAKAAIAHLTQCLALEWGPLGIRVNAIAPGYIETPMSSWMHGDPQAYESYMQRTPARRLGRPDEIASAVLFLSSQASSYVMGHVLVVDGGITHA
ncbi:SDR family NAD(P)-dependent oxidoreductase [Pseudomonas sp. H9]|uniref:SDR family NAD(P)-dependent oxidoreductase n=1 Tax=Pseudomonas sp. H9 TaxID=483968 RepID=UPI0010581D4F|nr:glucose 1-dehydrogenase [Pseudomonas sp. H9]TDF86723.1 SDR family oxidoreductase [Pseudomonas sp. H9]